MKNSRNGAKYSKVEANWDKETRLRLKTSQLLIVFQNLAQHFLHPLQYNKSSNNN